MSETTVLMTGAGAPGASGILKGLRAPTDRDIRVIGVDMNPDAYGFELVDASYVVPRADASDYISEIAAIGESEGVDVILPLTTAELEPLARNRDQFAATVMVSAVENLTIANDKGKLYQFLEDRSFPSAPRFERVNSESTFRKAVTRLGYPESAVCFKPPVASGMRGFRILEESTDRLDQLLETKPQTPVRTLDEIMPILTSGDSFPELLVMEYLPGEEYSVDVLCRDDTVAPVIPRSRSRTRAGITFEGKVEEKHDLIDEARRIAGDLGLEYNVNLQFKYDAEGTPKLIEINPRVSGTIIMCMGAGANMPYLGVKHALGESMPAVEIEWGTHMVRYWQELFRSPEGKTFQIHSKHGR